MNMIARHSRKAYARQKYRHTYKQTGSILTQRQTSYSLTSYLAHSSQNLVFQIVRSGRKMMVKREKAVHNVCPLATCEI